MRIDHANTEDQRSESFSDTDVLVTLAATDVDTENDATTDSRTKGGSASDRAARSIASLIAGKSLTRMITLTYSSLDACDVEYGDGFCACERPISANPVLEHLDQFARRMKFDACAATIELHADGRHLHAHLFVDRYIDKNLASGNWRRGHVGLRRFDTSASAVEYALKEPVALWVGASVG